MRELELTTVFGNPGSTELEFLHDWPADFRYMLGLQESIVVSMADGYAQATGRAAMVNLHSAAGVGHAMGSIYTAFRNHSPLVLTAGQQARSLLPYRPFLGAAQATELPRPYVKWSCEPARAEDVPLALLQAYIIAMQRPRGPVFISIPSDDWSRETTFARNTTANIDAVTDPAAVAKIAEKLASARRPALIFGAGIARDEARRTAVALSERLGCDVYAAPIPSRSSFDETHPLFKGVLPAIPELLFKALRGYDVVLVAGAPAFTFHVEGDIAAATDFGEILHVTDDPDTAASSIGNLVTVCSPGLAIEKILERLPGSKTQHRGEARKPPRLGTGAELSAEYVAELTAELLPAKCAVVEEAPSHKEIFQGQRMFGMDREYFAMSSGGLGFALPAAVGIAASGRFPHTVCIVGDGSAMYTIQALHAAAQKNFPISFLVLNNIGYGAMRAFSRMMKGSGAPGIDLPGLDFVRLSEGHGVPGRRVEESSEVESALSEAFRHDGPMLVDFRVGQQVAALYGMDEMDAD
jgi:benzoylformate decarboxylase